MLVYWRFSRALSIAALSAATVAARAAALARWASYWSRETSPRLNRLSSRACWACAFCHVAVSRSATATACCTAASNGRGSMLNSGCPFSTSWPSTNSTPLSWPVTCEWIWTLAIVSTAPTADSVTGIGFCWTRVETIGTGPPFPRPPPRPPAGAAPPGSGEEQAASGRQDAARTMRARRVCFNMAIPQGS